MSLRSDKLFLKEGWSIVNSSQVTDDAEIISAGYYVPVDWYQTTVPTTVLNALVKNGVYPDPRIGLNNFLIPDVSDDFNKKHDLAGYSYLPDKRNPWKDPYWFRTEFTLPVDCRERQWIVFNAINYRAEVWLNGKMIAGPEEMVGAFLRFRYDVTGIIKPGENNCLAVKIFCLDHPGTPGTQLVPFQPFRVWEDVPMERVMQGEIFKDVTFNMTAIGYDCAPDVRDRMMGIWQEVYLEFTGHVYIRDPYVKTKLPLPETNRAKLTVSAELVNATDKVQKGVLSGKIEEVGIVFDKYIELMPQEIKEIVFSPDEHPRLFIDNPCLWWPVGYGEQNLYDMTLSFEIVGEISDEENITFGVREVTKDLYELHGEYGLRIYINGQKVFCRGGYLMVDTLLDSEMLSGKRFEAELKYLKEANLNIFSMEDIPNLPDVFFDLCDKYGLMFWNCFFQCQWLLFDDSPLDHDLLEKCAADIIKRYRNHPSIVMYMCMNEGAAAEDQYGRWRKCVQELDGTRPFIPSGYGDYFCRDGWPEWIKKDTPVGANDNYPKSYTWQQHSWYYSMVREDRSWMFKIETGSASLPPVESLRKFMPDFGETLEGAPYPLNATWAHHGVNSYYQDYDRAIRRRFGEPESVEDYCWKAHLITADQHRAMFEAVNHLKWDVTSGFMQWKLNSCWPDVQWQIYDYYLRPMVSFYYIRKACEVLHVQLNPVNSMVTVVNNHLKPLERLDVKAGLYDFNMKLVWENVERIDIEADCYRNVFTIPYMDGLTPVYFVKLELLDENKSPVSDNFYWLSSKQGVDDTGCFADLKMLPQVKLDISYSVEENRDENIVRVEVKNPSDKLAFFIHLAVVKGQSGEEVLPVYWNDNYFSLLPGESKTVKAVFALEDLEGATPELRVDGWNIKIE